MPQYSYECEHCGNTDSVIAAMDEPRVAPMCCGVEMLRDYTSLQIISDEYKEPMRMTTMKPVWGNGPKHESGRWKGEAKYDVVHSESERKKWTQDCNDQLARAGKTETVRPTIGLKNFAGKRVSRAAS